MHPVSVSSKNPSRFSEQRTHMLRALVDSRKKKVRHLFLIECRVTGGLSDRGPY